MTELATFCRVCLESKRSNFSLYIHLHQKYLPSVIENICGVLISSLDEPHALICKECARAILQADEIIQKCRESHKIFVKQRAVLSFNQTTTKEDAEKQWQMKYEDNKAEESQLQIIEKAEEDSAEAMDNVGFHCKRYGYNASIKTPAANQSADNELPSDHSKLLHVKDETNEMADLDAIRDNLFVEPEMFVESILESSRDTTPSTPTNIATTKENESSCCTMVPSQVGTIYQSTFKITKPKKKFVRSREQYLKRKIRNYPVKEPLTLIGGAGVVRKRKPKSFHRAIPNFYFCCELCHEFESNVASYAVTHLNTVHGIERPAIFRCPHCDAKPFIKNQSLQEHVATIHQQQPKPRDYKCDECSKTFIKNCHLQKHLLSVHKRGEMPYRCELLGCGKGYADAFALRMHKQVHTTVADSFGGDGGDDAADRPRPFGCDSCDAGFVDIQALRSHMKSDHPAETYRCPKCGFKFMQKSRFETHVKRARCCKPPSFACRHCERTFGKLLQLEEHLRTLRPAEAGQVEYC